MPWIFDLLFDQRMSDMPFNMGTLNSFNMLGIENKRKTMFLGLKETLVEQMPSF